MWRAAFGTPQAVYLADRLFNRRNCIKILHPAPHAEDWLEKKRRNTLG
ncbi:hypothetical protein EDWATA_02877 [Edwardsiella tarda ATCC 23685]|uniref:Uncharacterized protein n=1 Tax=Edwardsiella tarda ATCC 23685 TaxID=500638 RepID=D4F7Z1_EDWTA|nr:hypothetical protein EDWATA_02877 [Edwardsiella tarda ATCC 23685]